MCLSSLFSPLTLNIFPLVRENATLLRMILTSCLLFWTRRSCKHGQKKQKHTIWEYNKKKTGDPGISSLWKVLPFWLLPFRAARRVAAPDDTESEREPKLEPKTRYSVSTFLANAQLLHLISPPPIDIEEKTRAENRNNPPPLPVRSPHPTPESSSPSSFSSLHEIWPRA